MTYYPIKIRLIGCLILSSVLSVVFFGVIMLARVFVNHGDPIWQIAMMSLAVGFSTVFLIDRMDNGTYRKASINQRQTENKTK